MELWRNGRTFQKDGIGIIIHQIILYFAQTERLHRRGNDTTGFAIRLFDANIKIGAYSATIDDLKIVANPY